MSAWNVWTTFVFCKSLCTLAEALPFSQRELIGIGKTRMRESFSGIYQVMDVLAFLKWHILSLKGDMSCRWFASECLCKWIKAPNTMQTLCPRLSHIAQSSHFHTMCFSTICISSIPLWDTSPRKMQDPKNIWWKELCEVIMLVLLNSLLLMKEREPTSEAAFKIPFGEASGLHQVVFSS